VAQGMMQLELETDCKNLRDALCSDVWDLDHDGVLLREIKFLIASSFNTVKVMYAPRSCNSIAHKLAADRAMSEHDSPSVWVTNLLSFVTDLVTNELMLIEG
jgi:hypothetical protein